MKEHALKVFNKVMQILAITATIISYINYLATNQWELAAWAALLLLAFACILADNQASASAKKLIKLQDEVIRTCQAIVEKQEETIQRQNKLLENQAQQLQAAKP